MIEESTTQAVLGKGESIKSRHYPTLKTNSEAVGNHNTKLFSSAKYHLCSKKCLYALATLTWQQHV